MIVSLSYKLSENTPFYVGLAKPSLERVYDLSRGDTTGFGKHRSDTNTYVEGAPSFSREAAEHVLRTLPHLRALAIDFVSLAALKHMEEGCEAHRVFLGCDGYSNHTVLLIEDARLPADMAAPERVIVAPWLFEGLDSAPCTVLAEFPDEVRA